MGPPATGDPLRPSGACLQAFWRQWRRFSAQAGKWTREGVKIPWIRVPKACKRKQKDLTDEEKEMLDKEVARMLEMGAIKESFRQDLILSSIYTVPKKNGKRRPVINLRWVNQHIQKIHFKMTTMRDVKQALTKDCWMASVDLTDCFWGLPLDERDQRACAFRWKGKNYVFRCLPFGLSLSPYFITKLYRNMVEHLQARGHRVIIYIDDILILADTQAECRRSVLAVQDCLQELGARINFDKSHLEPTQELEYLGFVMDSKEMKLWTPGKKLANTKKALKSFLRGGKATSREAASVLGKINALSDALLPARVHTAALHHFKMTTTTTHGWDFKATISKEAIDDVTWWTKNLQALNGRSIHPPRKDFDAGTDASDFGWGCWIRANGELRRWGGLFDKATAKEHINYKEMLAVKYFLESCPVDLRGKTVDLGIDNMTTLWYLKKWGGRKLKLAKLAETIWEVTHPTNMNHVNLISHHCPGVQNRIADEESRKKPSHGLQLFSDMALCKEQFDLLDRRWGPHSVDLFATHQDRRLRRYVSWSPQPGALWTDAMAKSWVGENGWANPPFSLLFQLLHKVRQEGSTISLLVPFWPSSPWMPMLLSMLVEAPVILPRVSGQYVHPLVHGGATPRWLTLACRISGKPSYLKVSRRRLLRRFSKPGSLRLRKTMTAFGDAGLRSATYDSKIRSLLMSLFYHRGWQS